jgi:hypothetical protein
MCKRILAAVLIIGCVGLSEFFLVDDPGSRSQPAYSVSTLGPRNISQAQRRTNPLIISSLGFASPSCSVSLVSTFHRQFRLSWLNHVFLI